jgi:hypothetical protein
MKSKSNNTVSDIITILSSGFVIFISIIIATIWIFNSIGVKKSFTLSTSKPVSYITILHDISQQKIADALEIKRLKIEEEQKKKEKQEELQDKINKVETFFTGYGAIMKGYGHILVEQADACGGDYRILVGIAGNESGLGRVPYKLYNPFGYLDGVQYESWDESLPFLSCTIAKRFLAPCNNDLTCIVNKYGGPDTDQDKWIRNVTWFMNQV